VHYLLAGDFFNRYETYSDFLDMLKNPKQFARWKNLVVHKPQLTVNICGNNPQEIFGDMDDDFMRQLGQIE